MINADDFGLSESVNDAIVECLEARRISSASVLVNAPASASALRFAGRHPEYSIGLHVNLTHFAPAGGDSMLARHGVFDGLGRLVRLQCTRPARFAAACFTEIGAQLDAFVRAAGRVPSHIDSHLWAQMLPGVFDAMMRASAARGVGCMRSLHGHRIVGSIATALRLAGPNPRALTAVCYQAMKALLIDGCARIGRHRRRLADAGLWSPATHVGVIEGLLYRSPEFRLRVLGALFAVLPAAQASELVVHPGGAGEGGPVRYDASDASIERAVLLSPEFADLCERHGVVVLRSYGARQV